MTFNSDRALRVLLVEDSPSDARLFQLAMAEGGPPCHLQTCADAVEAWSLLQPLVTPSPALPPDLIFLDLNLPGMSGRELLSCLKADRELGLIPVVILTSSSAEDDVRACYELGANCFITKPVQLDEFIYVVQTLLRFWSEVAEIPSPADGSMAIGRAAADT